MYGYFVHPRDLSHELRQRSRLTEVEGIVNPEELGKSAFET